MGGAARRTNFSRSPDWRAPSERGFTAAPKAITVTSTAAEMVTSLRRSARVARQRMRGRRGTGGMIRAGEGSQVTYHWAVTVENPDPCRIVLGISGASGAPYALRLLELLLLQGCEVHLVVSEYGRRLLLEESG